MFTRNPSDFLHTVEYRFDDVEDAKRVIRNFKNYVNNHPPCPCWAWRKKTSLCFLVTLIRTLSSAKSLCG